MKSKLIILFFALLFVSCGTREELKEDITLPELPSGAENNINIIMPTSSQTFVIGEERHDIIQVKWQGFTAEEIVHLELFDNSDFILNIETVTGISDWLWRIADTLKTSPHYKVKVYGESDTSVFKFSDEFLIEGLPDDSSHIPSE